MNQQNQDTISSPPPAANDLLAKRKRGRPRKDENSTHVTPKPEINLVGKMVSGVVEGSFDAGYILNVKDKDSDTKLRGVVFIPGRVSPITPENDVAPHAKMHKREEIKNSQTDQSPPSDQPMKEAAVTTNLETSESARGLSLIPQGSNGEFSVQAKEAIMEKEVVMVQGKEATMEKDGAVVQAKESMMEKDGVIEEAATRLVEFFPTPETMIKAVQPNLVLGEKETEQQKPPGETRGFDLMAEEPVCQGQGGKVAEHGTGEKVPEELQLELGNKSIIASGDNNSNITTTTETDPKSSVSKSGFIANLFEGEEKKVESNMAKEEEATPSKQ